MDLAHIQGIATRLCASSGWGAPTYVDCGASAAVYRSKIDGAPVALKIYDPLMFEEENASIEVNRIELQQQLRGHDCPYLIEIHDAKAIPADNTWYLLMPFSPWQSLEKRRGEIPDEKIHGIIKQLVLAIQYLSDRGFVHRDIKPANIIVSDDFDRIKLLDFGVLRKIAHDEGSGTDGSKFIATAQYSPPEFLTREEKEGSEGFLAINVYQVGAVLHDLITKTALFAEEKATKNKFKLYKAVTERVPHVVSESAPPRLIALCTAALLKNPQRRVKSVTLDDFLSDADDLTALRRRVARGQSSSLAVKPALLTWAKRVRSWGRAAAQLEVDVLGSVTMKAIPSRLKQTWRLTFSSTPAAICLEVALQDDILQVYVFGEADSERGTPVFLIGPDGANIPEAGIPSALAARYLYTLDTALTKLSDKSTCESRINE